MATLTANSLLGCNSIPDFIPAGTKTFFNDTSAPPSWTKDTTSHDNKSLRVINGTLSPGGSLPFTSTFSPSKQAYVGINPTGDSITVSSGPFTIPSSPVNEVPLLTVDSTTLTITQMASHTHTFVRTANQNQVAINPGTGLNRIDENEVIETEGMTAPGNSASHNHAWAPAPTSINHSHPGIQVGPHEHNFSHQHADGIPAFLELQYSPNQIPPTQQYPYPSYVEPQNFAILYVDIILATKD